MARVSNVLTKLVGGSGATVWNKTVAGNATGFGVAIDGTGAVVLTGPSVGDVDFGGGPVPGFGDVDIFLARYSQ